MKPTIGLANQKTIPSVPSTLGPRECYEHRVNWWEEIHLTTRRLGTRLIRLVQTIPTPNFGGGS